MELGISVLRGALLHQLLCDGYCHELIFHIASDSAGNQRRIFHDICQPEGMDYSLGGAIYRSNSRHWDLGGLKSLLAQSY